MDTKIIVSHGGALRAKYGSTGLAAIRKAVAALAKADKARGLKTQLVLLDDARQMKAAGAATVAAGAAPRAFKAAIDAVWRQTQPPYLMILGATDVVPHQDLRNPVYEAGGDDEDRFAWSDLPYACEAGYSTDSARFVGPTRVVGRLPDLAGATEPSFLLKLLSFAAQHQPLPAKAYAKAFGLTAKVWRGSTRKSLDALVGPANALQLSPPKGPSHAASVMAPRLHFINCHGDTASPEFQGEFPARKYTLALSSHKVAGRITERTVAAVECCYGAELYDSVTLALDLPICQHYLVQGACGWLGSTTVAYGSFNDSGQADLICMGFVDQVQKGASLGRALLAARQAFVQQAAQMDPMDLKTLAQFVLLGDPSLTPVQAATESAAAKGLAAKGSAAKSAAKQTLSFERAERRAALKATGRFLARSKPTASKPEPHAKPAAKVTQALSNIALAAGLKGGAAFRAFAVKAGADAAEGAVAGKPAAKAVTLPTRYHLAVRRVAGSATGPAQSALAIVAKELDGRIVGWRVYARR